LEAAGPDSNISPGEFSNPYPAVLMKSFRLLVGLSLLWALTLIAASYFLRGTPGADWVDALLYIGAGLWFGAYVLRPSTSRCA